MLREREALCLSTLSGAMGYERIHKVQMGVISPSKLRLKLLGAHNSGRKESGNNSSRTSPSKLEEQKNAKDSLLSRDLDADVSSIDSKDASMLQADITTDASQLEFTSKEITGYGQGNQTNTSTRDLPFKEKGDTSRMKNQNIIKGASYQVQHGGNLSTVYPMRSQEEDGNGYDSGHDVGSTSSFEFHRTDRTFQNSGMGPFLRHVPSKWNDAEKWLVNRQAMNQNLVKKTSQNQVGRQIVSSWGRITPEAVATDQKNPALLATDTKRIDSMNLTSQNVVEKFSFVPQINSTSTNGISTMPRVKEEQNDKELSVSHALTAETTVPTVQSVSMRDVGTEMTPIPSQEPSRTGTPIGATTPTDSMPSTPKRGVPTPSPADSNRDDERDYQKTTCKTELSERELQLKTRREIAALGTQLGKMNIASWASKNESEPATPSLKPFDVNELLKTAYEGRAAAWEEAEKIKHTARYKREEIKIQAWEDHQKAKFEAQLRKAEVKAERMTVRTQEKMAKKLALTQQRVEDKQAAAEALRNQRAARTVQQAEQIRQTGRISTGHFGCCSWFL